jgi:pyridinium-3,5-bisthiocarboxylic acid mononucleotide nickel chelatase
VTIAYCDTISGIAGDMTMAAFVSAGVPVDFLGAELRKLPLEGFELAASHVRRSAIDAVHIDVVVTRQPSYHRHLKDILAIVEGSTLTPRIKERAASIFRVVADAEAKIHNVPLDKVHFHEVGAIDSIVDIVGVCICLEYFGVERLYSSAIRLGSGGFVNAEHGRMPTPTPATLEILRDYPCVLTSVPHELTTPTGAAIIKALSSGLLDDEQIVVTSVGYGAGTKEFPELPNLLRVIVGDLHTGTEQEELIIVETNIDDMNPQVYPFIIDRLLGAGAHDAYLVPIIMKKGRPGVLLSVMTGASRLDEVTSLIYRHTSTIGLRVQRVGRRKLPRREVELQTSFGPVRAKAVLRDGREVLTAEYEECRRIAETTGLSILDVIKQLEKEAGERSA